LPNHPATCVQELTKTAATITTIIFFIPLILQRLCR
jgi:hypothetical protein